ncbi:uncharacterized protein SPSK_05917 [Sporothrix schenckii 1099-18]|uniref:Peptidase S8/S53 domain-containing protein n=2 Tax=Sporothrix schenckii TaxID=29908 RepID=U7PST8_SPOS1|nr:uncharacterized protein SPSK_05917 [Sporothrix schenckii 1099-18]ERS98667.1 hypothetical protein HMPREF1624_05454 [Sporothrix schenckii ATCC 58251]KJR89145.1 hypothetical protein SPSK_05917 [Sporothrix schenckii 1099-18]
MHIPAILAVPLVAGAVSAAVGGPGSQIIEQAARAANAENIVPGNYIVEFEDGHDGSEFYNAIAANASKKMDLNFKLFRGASIQFHAPDETSTVDATAQLQALPAVKRMWPVRQYRIPEHTRHWVANLSSDDDHARRAAADDTLSTHVMTQVTQLRAKGITGKGVRVAVVDTGVDYLHPALGGCFGPGCLVSFGYDLVGDAYTGTNKPVPSGNPPMDCNGHGTHVSGILAAQGGSNSFGVTGAAPGVELGMFRVFGCEGNVNDDVLIAAFNRAYEAGADVITSSVGGSSGWSDEAWAVATSRIVANGVPCTLSAGNDGSSGQFYASAAADGLGVVSVASVDNAVSPTLFSKATFAVKSAASPVANTSFGYTAGSPANWSSVTLPLWADTYNTSTETDLCEALPAKNSTNDLSGYIVLARRGTCLFTIKAQNAARRGAKYVLLYNNEPGTLQVDVSSVPGIVGMAMVTADQGAAWIAALARNETVLVAMTDPLTAPKGLNNANNTVSGGFVSSFSSWGPTFDLNVKPQFAAPGGQILSTFPRSQGAYAVLSGTSMACPLVAGIYALLIEARPDLRNNPQALQSLLSSTAQPNLYNDGTSRPRPSLLAPVPQQGAGLVQVYDAAYATTLLSESSLSFNDTDHHAPLRNFTITNHGHTSVVYTLSNIGAATSYTFLAGTDIQPAHFPLTLQVADSPASLSFSTSDQATASGDGTTVTIPAGQRRVVTVSATPPAGLDPARLPVYSGYIAINGSDGSGLSLPYLGVVGSMRSLTVLDAVQTYLGKVPAASGNSTNSTAVPGLGARRVPANTLFVLPVRLTPGQKNLTDAQQAALQLLANANHTASLVQTNLNFVMGSPLIRADLVPIKLCSSPTTPAPALQDILGYKTLGSIQSFPVQWMSRDPFNATWDGSMTDGTYAPPGLYKIVFHALHIFGDPKQPSDYDIVETDPFRIKYLEAPSTTSPAGKAVPKMMRRQTAECP